MLSIEEAWNSIPNMEKEGEKRRANIFLSSNCRDWEMVQWAKCLLSNMKTYLDLRPRLNASVDIDGSVGKVLAMQA